MLTLNRDLSVVGLIGCMLLFVSFISKMCVCLCERGTHVVRRAVFPIKRFGDEHLSEHGVDIEHLIGWLIGSHPSDAVPDWDVLILVRANLHDSKQERNNQSVGQWCVYKSPYCVSLGHMPFYCVCVPLWRRRNQLKRIYHGRPVGCLLFIHSLWYTAL